MDGRRKDLSNLKTYIDNTDKEITMILRNFFWDQKHILAKPPLTECRYIPHHKIPEKSKSEHEEKCYLTRHGYTLDEPLLPDPVDDNAKTLVKLGKQEIREIINAEVRLDPTFKTSEPCQGPEPLSVARLQQAYTAGERRAIHNAVVNAAPFCHDLADLALGNNTNMDGKKTKTRLEVLAELRDMRRRRVKYRVASKTSNYSNVLKDVIKTQMDLYAEANGMFIKTEYGSKTFVSLNDKNSISRQTRTSEAFFIKQERVSPEAEVTKNDTGSEREKQQDREKRERDRDRHSRENSRYDSNRRHANRSRSRDRDRNTRRYRDERDDRSTGYKRNERDVDSDRPQAYRNEKNDNKKSYNSRYESRDRYDKINRYGGTPKHENRYIRESRTKIENAYTDETELVKIKQEFTDEDEARRDITGTYDDEVKESQEHEDRHRVREAYRLRNEYRNRRETKEERRKRNRDEDINDDKQRYRNEDRLRHNNRDESKRRNRGEDGNGNRNKYNDTHGVNSGDNNENKRRCEDKDENSSEHENRQRDENRHKHKHENRDDSRHQCENEDRNELKGKHHEDKNEDSGSRHERHANSYRQKDKHRHKDRHRHGERHAKDKRKYEEPSFDANVMSRVKLEKEDSL